MRCTLHVYKNNSYVDVEHTCNYILLYRNSVRQVHLDRYCVSLCINNVHCIIIIFRRAYGAYKALYNRQTRVFGARNYSRGSLHYDIAKEQNLNEILPVHLDAHARDYYIIYGCTIGTYYIIL